MKYFTSLTIGEPHEPKTLICAHHSYNKNDKGIVVNIFGYSVEKQDKSGEFKPLKWSEQAVKITINAYLCVFGVEGNNTEIV
jgi:hypothetical protein